MSDFYDGDDVMKEETYVANGQQQGQECAEGLSQV